VSVAFDAGSIAVVMGLFCEVWKSTRFSPCTAGPLVVPSVFLIVHHPFVVAESSS